MASFIPAYEFSLVAPDIFSSLLLNFSFLLKNYLPKNLTQRVIVFTRQITVYLYLNYKYVDVFEDKLITEKYWRHVSTFVKLNQWIIVINSENQEKLYSMHGRSRPIVLNRKGLLI